MRDKLEEHRASEADQPGTSPMSPGDEVPPGTANAGENICQVCGGSGRHDGTQCRNCGGTGLVTQAVSGGA